MDEDTSPSLLGAAFVTGNSSDDGKAKSLWGHWWSYGGEWLSSRVIVMRLPLHEALHWVYCGGNSMGLILETRSSTIFGSIAYGKRSSTSRQRARHLFWAFHRKMVPRPQSARKQQKSTQTLCQRSWTLDGYITFI